VFDDQLVILGTSVGRGESAILEMDVAKLHTRNSLKIPVIVERAVDDGPVLLLIGGVHGDETNGVAIVRDIIRKGYNKPKSGTIICIPVFNVIGYLNQDRKFPDGRDLNRMFPGSASGSLASQFAHKFKKEIAPLADYVLDFHTGGADRDNYPNVRCVINQEPLLELAQAFGAPFIVNSPYIAKSLRQTMYKMGKPILVFEGGKSLTLDQRAIDFGVNGVFNVMIHLGMQEGESSKNKDSIIIKKSKWIRAPYSGMFHPIVQNGTRVETKQIIGKILDPYGEFEKSIHAPFDCYVFGLNTTPNVYKGDAIAHVSLE
jgi:uncharacterized protein